MSSEPFEENVSPAVPMTASALSAAPDAHPPTAQERRARTEESLATPVKAQLDGVAAQLDVLQQQIDALIAGRTEAVAERASNHVAAIVAAAEKSAAEIRASAEKDAAVTRERLMADVQVEVERIRAEALADGARIRAEAYAQAARASETPIMEAIAEIHSVCERLAEGLRGEARTAIAGLADERTSTPTKAAPRSPARTTEPSPAATAMPAGEGDEQLTNAVEAAVHELQTATTELERSLRTLRPIHDDRPRAKRPAP